jgi:hypothetical protein
MLSNFILIPCCITLLLSWICIELFYYKRPLKEIHTLSRHTIMHQHTGWYHLFLNLLWFLITISLFLKFHNSFLGLFIIILNLILLFDLWFGYNIHQNLNDQFTKNYHNTFLGGFLVLLFIYMISLGVNILTLSCFMLLTCLLLYFGNKTEFLDKSPEYSGMLEFGLFVFLIIFFILYSSYNKNSLGPKVSSKILTKVK